MIETMKRYSVLDSPKIPWWGEMCCWYSPLSAYPLIIIPKPVYWVVCAYRKIHLRNLERQLLKRRAARELMPDAN